MDAEQAKQPKQSKSVMSFLPVVGILGVLVLLYVTSQPSPDVAAMNGTVVKEIALAPFYMPVPDSGETEGLEQVKTLADLKGKVTFISFWATWCGPCRQELPHLGAIAERFAEDSGVQVWTVLLEGRADRNTREAVAALFKEKGVALPVYVPSGPLEPESLVPEGIPAALLIGPDGKVAGAWEGYHSDLESQVAELVAKLQEVAEPQGTQVASSETP